MVITNNPQNPEVLNNEDLFLSHPLYPKRVDQREVAVFIQEPRLMNAPHFMML